ncbi:DUF3150 domain-containing protein [Marinobacter sp. P4B1]|uniref:DUF3150 domain-containing protein n=1 Tax=Marinobacter sp. P4B1 TaxID=1119533 RepID=UPI00071D77C4|nr:DUF3150 domain-containing protein [Marinobacter sp. P4B1]KRW83760.1 hypothetical protein AQ621_17065 [Marinobacter sp. P4B1]
MNTSSIDILEQVVCVSLDVRIWSGRRMLKKEDLMVQGTLPPSDLVSLGSKKIIDPSELSVFNAMKKRMERACLEYGTRFLGGYAVPLERFNELSAELNDAVNEATMKKQDLLNRYDSLIDSWCAKHPTYEAIIRKATVPSPVVDERINFNWMSFRVNPVTNDEEAEKRLDTQVKGLGQKLMDEISKEAEIIYGRSFKDKQEVTQKIIAPIRRLQKKMVSLSFVDNRIKPLSKEIDDVLDALPKTGKLKGMEFFALRGLMELLSDDERIRAFSSDDAKATDDSEDVITEEVTTESVVADEVTSGDEIEEADIEEDVLPMPTPQKPKTQPLKGWVF